MTAKPASFTPEGAPVGVEIKFYSQWKSRPMLDAPARIAAVHTNAAEKEGSVDSASAWSERNVSDPANDYSIPHYQVDRDGRARKMLPSNRRGICNATVLPDSKQWSTLTTAQQAEVLKHPVNVSKFSIAIETADTGTIADPTISDFTPVQAERIAEILAYESLVPGNEIPLVVPTAWYGSGVGAHTDPFPFPFWTTVRGKPCPGAKKKQSLRTLVIPRAVAIRAEWLAPPPPPEEDDMFTDEDRARLKKVHDALLVDEAVMPTYPSIFTMVNQIRTVTHTAWGGKLGDLVTKIAAKLGIPTG